MTVANLNGTDLFYVEVGEGLPCLVMHGGLGFDHTCLHPWLDPLGGVMRAMPSWGSGSSLRAWGEISVPTLIVGGKDDFICPPSQAKIMHERIPNSESVIFEKSGHFVIDRSSSSSACTLLMARAITLRYADDFSDARVPRDPSFNEQDVSDKPSYVHDLPPLTRAEIRDLDALYRNQLRSLRTVDDAIREITGALRSAGELHNTYIVFYTDNGVHRGHHRIRYGKKAPYQTDTRFPIIMRGPRIPANSSSYKLASSNDIAPTLARMGGAAIPSFVDGRSLLAVADGHPPAIWRTALLSYRWRKDTPLESGERPEWWALMTGRRTYVEYETGEREFYNLDTDAYELRNAYDTLSLEAKQNLHERLENLKSCAGGTCAIAENRG